LIADSKYIWPVLTGIYVLLWFCFYLIFKSHRKSLLFGLVFGFAGPICEFISIPEYWNPGFLIPFIIQTPLKTWHFGIEDILSSIAYSGICFGIFEKFYSRRKNEFSERNFKLLSLLAWISLGLSITSFLFFIIGLSGINSTNIGMFTTGAVFYLFNSKYLKTGIKTSVVMATLYWLILVLICLPLFPDMFNTTWNIKRSFYIVGVPLDEIIWAASTSFVAGPVYRVTFAKSDYFFNN